MRAEAGLDVLVVGAGPIGLETAWACGERGLSAAVVDQGAIGATMRWWAPGTKFFSGADRIEIAGVTLSVANQDKATREQYIDYLVQVARTRDLSVRTFTRVDSVERPGGAFEVSVSDARTGAVLDPVRANAVVLAIGNMHRPHLLGIEGEGLPNVSHYLRDPSEYVGRRVLLVGGKNSAVEAAIRLHRAGADVVMSYRGGEFSERVKYWLRPELEWLIERGLIEFHPGTVPLRIDERGAVLGALLGGEGAEVRVDADDVLLLTGYVQDTGLFESMGIELTGETRHPVFDRRTMETNVPGVYVAGTATGGTSVGGVRVFIETAHVHAERIAAALAGEALEVEQPDFGAQEES